MLLALLNGYPLVIANTELLLDPSALYDYPNALG